MNSASLYDSRGVGETLKEAWKLVGGFKFPVLMVFFLNFFSLSFFKLIAGFISNVLKNIHAHSFAAGFLVFMLSIIIMIVPLLINTLFTSMHLVLGVRRATALPVRISYAFEDCKAKYGKILLMMVLAGLIGMGIFTLGALSVLLTIYVHGSLIVTFILWAAIVCLSLYIVIPLGLFAVPLLIMRDVSIRYALSLSYRAMKANYFKILVCIIAMLVIIFLSAIPFGIGLIWTLPMHVALLGILYRDCLPH